MWPNDRILDCQIETINFLGLLYWKDDFKIINFYSSFLSTGIPCKAILIKSFVCFRAAIVFDWLWTRLIGTDFRDLLIQRVVNSKCLKRKEKLWISIWPCNIFQATKKISLLKFFSITPAYEGTTKFRPPTQNSRL